MRLALFASALLLSATASAGGNPEGYWKSIDDETGLPESVVHIVVEDGVATGTIVQLYRTPDQTDDPFCTDCKTPELQKTKIIGMDILQGCKEDADEWSGGTIMDPGNGKTYGAFVEVLEDGKKLKVRGYIGFSLLGRTQYWYRIDPPDQSIRTFRLHDDGSITPLILADGTKAGE